jgi:hypothetical protein
MIYFHNDVVAFDRAKQRLVITMDSIISLRMI